MRALITPEDFYHRLIPELQSRWDQHCFCRNEHFLKLVSFNFRDYGIAPVALTDAEYVILSLRERLESIGDWQRDRNGQQTRQYRCPQCAELFEETYDQFSINMDCSTLLPSRALPRAPIGRYVLGYHYFAKEEQSLERISDFERAESVEQFVTGISQVSPT